MNWKKFAVFGTFLAIVVLITAVNGASVERGKEVYDNYCLVCHGEKGDGQKDKGVDFSDPNFWAKETDEEIEEVIENGRGQMPPWKGTLSSDDIHSVIMYIKTFSNIAPSVTETHSEEPKETKETPHTEVKTKSQPGFEIMLALLAVSSSIYLLKRNQK